MFHPKQEQARIASQILASYNNTKELTTPTIAQTEFEKAVKADKIPFFLEEVVKAYATDMEKRLKSTSKVVEKSELSEKISSQLSCLKKVDVVFNGVKKSVWVDMYDAIEKSYKVNALTVKLGLVEGESIEKAEGDKGGKVIGHTKSGKPIYEHAKAKSYKDFTRQDHHDAYTTHRKLWSDERSKTKDKFNQEKSNNHLKHFQDHESARDSFKPKGGEKENTKGAMNEEARSKFASLVRKRKSNPENEDVHNDLHKHIAEHYGHKLAGGFSENFDPNSDNLKWAHEYLHEGTKGTHKK